MDAVACPQSAVAAASGTVPACDSVKPPQEPQSWMDAAPGTRHHILMKSNEPPLDSDVVVVQSVISEADERLAWLANEISQLRDRLQRLEEEQVSLSSFRAQNSTILSPLRRMPPELLSEIFAWTLPSVKQKRRKLRIMDSPWVFTHVSRHWRAIAVLNPALWSFVGKKPNDLQGLEST
ncbi:hypothetical protein DFH06DRAFT_1416513 [Mycena polygramma]|nr:hypothetical protein DFH06DRAFT_1416513 [Mycena polygramma]